MRLIGDYISYIKDIRRYSARTQAIYSDALKVFVEDCGAATDEELLKSLTPQVIRSHEVYLLDKREDSPRTVKLHLSVLSGFCRYLMKEKSWRSIRCVRLRNPRWRKGCLCSTGKSP